MPAPILYSIACPRPLNRRIGLHSRHSRDGPLPPRRLRYGQQVELRGSLQLARQIVESQQLEPHTDLRKAMTNTIERLKNEGWRQEGAIDYGFVFLNRNGVRRLLILTERDPYDTRTQTFSPFK